MLKESEMSLSFEGHNASKGLYTEAQRERRDATKWTTVQGVLAPVQFVVFLGSLCCVAGYLITGDGYAIATASIVLKTTVLYIIMVTGAIWEKVVFGQYLLAPAFFWEDIVSFAVIAFHTLYLFLLFSGLTSEGNLILIALIAYFIYLINAIQFLWKFRQARLEQNVEVSHA